MKRVSSKIRRWRERSRPKTSLQELISEGLQVVGEPNLHTAIDLERCTQNGIFTSHDITLIILKMHVYEHTDKEKQQSREEYTKEMNRRYVCLRMVCRKWRDMVDQFFLAPHHYTTSSTAFVRLLLHVGVDPSVENNYVIIYASQFGHTEIVRVLLQDKRVDPSAGNNCVITWASGNGCTEIVRRLLEDKRVDPSAGNNEAIRTASLWGRTEIVRMLLEDERVDPSAKNNEAIRSASFYAHTETVRLLIQDERVDPSAWGNEALRSALGGQSTEIVRMLSQDKHVISRGLIYQYQ